MESLPGMEYIMIGTIPVDEKGMPKKLVRSMADDETPAAYHIPGYHDWVSRI